VRRGDVLVTCNEQVRECVLLNPRSSSDRGPWPTAAVPRNRAFAVPRMPTIDMFSIVAVTVPSVAASSSVQTLYDKCVVTALAIIRQAGVQCTMTLARGERAIRSLGVQACMQREIKPIEFPREGQMTFTGVRRVQDAQVRVLLCGRGRAS
jgi:hypothetical protein